MDYQLYFTAIITLLLVLYIISTFYIKIKNKPSLKKSQPIKSPHIITSRDIRAIAGDDMIATQLDLARAYMEIGKKQLARKILDHTIKQGNITQQQEAKKLLRRLE